MKLSEIKTELFTSCNIMSFGVQLNSVDNKTMSSLSDRIKVILQARYNMPLLQIFTASANIKNDGSVNITTFENVSFSNDQINEIVRVANILKMES